MKQIKWTSINGFQWYHDLPHGTLFKEIDSNGRFTIVFIPKAPTGLKKAAPKPKGK